MKQGLEYAGVGENYVKSHQPSGRQVV